MIMAEQKSLAEINEVIGNAIKVLVVGCGGCVTICHSGGQKETEILASALRLKRGIEGRPVEITEATLERQCDPEYVEKIDAAAEAAECIVSLACGVGVQFLADRYPTTYTVPAQNTKFAGGTLEHGSWEERCGLCGECILASTGGICPIIRCAKSMLNGPCGGSHGGLCEIGRDVPCAWSLIYERLRRLGRESSLRQIRPLKDWSKARDGGLRRMAREDLRA